MTWLSSLSKHLAPPPAPGAQLAALGAFDCASAERVWKDGDFSTAVTALGAKLASAEGPQRPREFEAFAAVFKPQPAAEADIRRLYRLARQTTLGETAYLDQVATALGLPAAIARSVRARRLGRFEDDPYHVLDVAPDASDDLVRAAWRKAMVETHPDKAIAQGLPSHLVERAQAKAQAINAAFDRVMHERRSGLGALAAELA